MKNILSEKSHIPNDIRGRLSIRSGNLNGTKIHEQEFKLWPVPTFD